MGFDLSVISLAPSCSTLSQKYRDFPKYATECSLEVVIWNGMVRGFFPNYVAGDFKVPLIVPHYC